MTAFIASSKSKATLLCVPEDVYNQLAATWAGFNWLSRSLWGWLSHVAYLFYSSCCYIGWPKDVFPVHVPCSFCVKMR